MCVTACFAVIHLCVESVLFVCWFVCLSVCLFVGVCVCARMCVCVCLSGRLSLCLLMLVSVDLLVLPSSTCIAASLPHTCVGREKRALSLLVVSASLLACLGLFGVGVAGERSKFNWPKGGCSSEVRNGQSQNWSRNKAVSLKLAPNYRLKPRTCAAKLEPSGQKLLSHLRCTTDKRLSSIANSKGPVRRIQTSNAKAS